MRVDIDECAVMSIAGKPTRKEVRLMLAYVERYRDDLLEVWNELQGQD